MEGAPKEIVDKLLSRELSKTEQLENLIDRQEKVIESLASSLEEAKGVLSELVGMKATKISEVQSLENGEI